MWRITQGYAWAWLTENFFYVCSCVQLKRQQEVVIGESGGGGGKASSKRTQKQIGTCRDCHHVTSELHFCSIGRTAVVVWWQGECGTEYKNTPINDDAAFRWIGSGSRANLGHILPRTVIVQIISTARRAFMIHSATHLRHPLGGLVSHRVRRGRISRGNRR